MSSVLHSNMGREPYGRFAIIGTNRGISGCETGLILVSFDAVSIINRSNIDSWPWDRLLRPPVPNENP
jgi:hypothetical protein